MKRDEKEFTAARFTILTIFADIAELLAPQLPPKELAGLVSDFIASIQTTKDFQLLNTGKLKLLLKLTQVHTSHTQNPSLFTRQLRVYLMPVLQNLLSYHLKNATEAEIGKVAEILLVFLQHYFDPAWESVPADVIELLPLLPSCGTYESFNLSAYHTHTYIHKYTYTML